MKRNQSLLILSVVMCLLFTVDMFPAATQVEELPVMTSNTTPWGIAAASSIYSSYYEAWRAFDGEDESESRSCWISESSPGFSTPQWISYNMGKLQYISHYYILPDYDINTRTQSPKNWELQGWNGTTWVTVDTRTNIRINQEWDYRGLYFQIANPAGYQTLRLYITAVNGADMVSIRKFKLLEPKDLVPVMTSNSTPSGLAEASSIYSSSYEAWRAFDGDNESLICSGWISQYTSGFSSPQWLSYSFVTPQYITHYYILPPNSASIRNRTPKDWQLQGWNGSAWVTIDSRSNIRNDIEWGFGGGLYLDVAYPDSYTQYRLYVTAVNGSDVVHIIMLKFYSN